MKQRLFCFLLLFITSMTAMSDNKKISFRVIETSDVHGCFFPYDFINRRQAEGSLARVITYVDSLRQIYGDNLLLFDNGDILQGQPTCYYCNYVKPNQPNLAAEIINYMRYDAQTIGNHDIETGHAVYDKWIKEVNCPMLGANVIDTKTGKPYVNPYTIIERDSIRIAVIGLLTPAIPNWLNENLWSGLRFEEMVESARKWVKHVKEEEHADIVIGLFHSGKEGGIKTDDYEEDASLRVAREVPGFDLVLYGHDHKTHCDFVKNVDDEYVVCLDPSCNALMISDAEIDITLNSRNKIVERHVSGEIVDIRNLKVDEKYMNHFQPAIDSVMKFVNREIGKCSETIYTRDCYFGSAPFTDFIHDLQLKLTGADISLNAPLTFDTAINKGTIRVSDMFNLYKYENQIYVLMLSGEEIRNHLEMSYDLWVNTMTSPDDHIMRLREYSSNGRKRYSFENLAFNFDSAAGIDYIVDVTKPDGEKVEILRMSSGEPFNPQKMYRVVMNSYRGNGGGELLTKGAGIPHSELRSRIVYESERDQRYYLMEKIKQVGTMNPVAHNNWRFVPEEWTKPAIERDRKLLFNR